MTPHLVIFLKEPHPGRVKTRLGRDIGMAPAAWWFRHQTRRLLRDLGRDPRWQTVLAVTPDREGLTSRIWPTVLPRWPQGRGDLGERMARALHQMPHGPVIIIGADVPGITPAHIARAFAMLGQHDAVVGPATDGGYWLIGLRRGGRPVPAHLFDNVRWSGPHALGDTLAGMGDLSVGMTDEMRDIDTAADLAALR